METTVTDNTPNVTNALLAQVLMSRDPPSRVDRWNENEQQRLRMEGLQELRRQIQEQLRARGFQQLRSQMTEPRPDLGEWPKLFDELQLRRRMQEQLRMQGLEQLRPQMKEPLPDLGGWADWAHRLRRRIWEQKMREQKEQDE
jgi:uncharacterized protein YnzC (UPF0291/DUF896 family)